MLRMPQWFEENLAANGAATPAIENKLQPQYCMVQVTELIVREVSTTPFQNES